MHYYLSWIFGKNYTHKEVDRLAFLEGSTPPNTSKFYKLSAQDLGFIDYKLIYILKSTQPQNQIILVHERIMPLSCTFCDNAFWKKECENTHRIIIMFSYNTMCTISTKNSTRWDKWLFTILILKWM